MATAPQWPRPTGLDDQIDDPLVLVDRFKQHYISICHHTADDPTATAPASYVLDVMFQANKVITLLAKQMGELASRQQMELIPVLDAKVAVQDEISGGCEGHDEKMYTDETRLEVDGADGGEIAHTVIGTIHGFNWGEADPEDEQDWQEDESEERNSEDEYYEYGDFGNEEEEEEGVNDDQPGNDVQIEQQGEEKAAQEDPEGDNAEPAQSVVENFAGRTILEMDLHDEDSAEDQNWEDDGSEHNSEDDYYEYGDFADDEKEEEVVEGEPQSEVPVSFDDQAEKATEGTQNAIFSNFMDKDWGDEDSERDEDYEGSDSSDHDSEDDYYEYGDFSDEDEDEPDNGVQHQIQNAQANKPEIQTEDIIENSDANLAAALAFFEVAPGWRKVSNWTCESELDMSLLPASRTSALSPGDAETPFFKIRWGCAIPPYKHYSFFYVTREEIIREFQYALAKSDLTKLKDIRVSNIEPDETTGDLEVHLATAEDKACLLEHAKDWLPLLTQGEYARIPNVYHSDAQDDSAASQQMDSPERGINFSLPGLKLQWRYKHGLHNFEGISFRDHWNVIKAVLNQTGKPEVQKVRISHMDVIWPSRDTILHFHSRADRDTLFDNEFAWVPYLPDSHRASIIQVYNPEENPFIKTSGAESERQAEAIPASSLEAIEGPTKLTIHWRSDAPYRAWESRGLEYEEIDAQLSLALDKTCEPTPNSPPVYSFTIDSESGDVEVSFESSTYRTQAVENITTWFPFLERGDIARIPGLYNPLRRAKSNAKVTRQNRSPLSEVGQEKRRPTSNEDSIVQDEMKGIEVEGEKGHQPAVQAQGGQGLERKKSKKRFRRWQQKVKKNEVLAC